MQWTIVALAAVLALAAGCGQSASAKIAVTSIDGEAGDAASDGAGAEVGMALCCALPPVDAGSGDAAATLEAADNCSVIARNGLGVVEPCLSSNSGGTYGLWTCGTGSPQRQCGENGLSCNAGDPCTLVDIGCPGVVQACSFTPYTPPPGLSDSGAG